MSIRVRGVCAIGALLLSTMTAAADWDPSADGHKMHFPQLPDLEFGMNVTASFSQTFDGQIVEKWLGDDWKCSQTGLVNRIHIWGSWRDDLFPTGPGHGTFHLAIYKDIPAGVDGIPWSRPGELLWEGRFFPGQYIVQPWAISQEPFYDPNIDQIIGFDSQVLQYNFCIPRDVAFKQREGETYWLAVHNLDPNGDGVVNLLDLTHWFGWKSSRDHFNDAAAFADAGPAIPGSNPPPPGGSPPWRPMFHPSGHPFAGQPIDLSFVIDECLADMDGDCRLTGIDVGLFLQGYNQHQPWADMNCDGLFNGIDVGLFLQAYGVGC